MRTRGHFHLPPSTLPPFFLLYHSHLGRLSQQDPPKGAACTKPLKALKPNSTFAPTVGVAAEQARAEAVAWRWR